MTRRTSRGEIGNAVFSCLTRMSPTIEEGIADTGLSRAQWRTGLQYVRDVLTHNPSALTYEATDRRYHLDGSEIETYIRAHIRLFTQQLRQLYDGQFVPNETDLFSPLMQYYRDLDEKVRKLLCELEELSEPDVRIPS